MAPASFRHRLRSLLLAATLVGATLSPSGALAGLSSLSRLYVFGDSLSDNGNSKQVSETWPGYATTFPPSPPYFGGRFSNGLVAAEVLWQSFNPGPANPALQPSLLGGTNYAIGGATTGVENFVQVWGVTPPLLRPAYENKGNAWQLAEFLADAPSFDPESSLFLVWLFPNDPFYVGAASGAGVGTFDGNPSTPGVVLPTSVDNIVGTIETLANNGARKFLVPNSPDLGLIPEFIGTGQQAGFTALSTAFNDLLSTRLAGLAASRPELEIVPFQTDDLFSEVRANQAAFGFSDVENRCLVSLVPFVQCTTPDSYLFWDGSHPTAAGHQLIGQRFFTAVYAPVPGPVPALGAMAAFGWSRRLRRRIRLRPRRTSRSCAGRCPAD